MSNKNPGELSSTRIQKIWAEQLKKNSDPLIGQLLERAIENNAQIKLARHLNKIGISRIHDENEYFMIKLDEWIKLCKELAK